MAKRKLTAEQRIKIAERYLTGKASQEQIAREYLIDRTTVRRIVAQYKSQGVEYFFRHNNKKYSRELKLNAVNDYLSGKGSQKEICLKYKISNKSILRQWVKVYNGHKEFKEHNSSGRGIYMTKGRKTTQEERSEIVAFCIEHGKDYSLTTETYKVSYQQIYSWVKKYEEKGVDGLKDNRGRTKPEEEMTEIEKLRAENRILQAKLREKEMENALLKKLRELRGGGR